MLKFLLFPISFLYSFILKIRNLLYNNNIITGTFFSDVTVISIGNLAVGGTGKTPHTDFLVSFLKKDYNTAVLSRGYKRETKGFLYVDSDNSYKKVGDEPLQIATKHQEITVAVSENRVKAIKKLKNEKDIHIVILDDAFQHRKVIPQTSILLTTYQKPYHKDFFLPVGTLRDNKSECSRANIVIVTKCPDNLKPTQKTIFKQDLRIKPSQEIFFTSIKYQSLKNVFYEKTIQLKKMNSYTAVLISGIANSKNFEEFVKNEITNDIKHLKYADHKQYTEKDNKKICEVYNNLSNNNKLIITTEKDAMRLKELTFDEKIKQNIYFLPIEINFLFNETEQFKELIQKNILIQQKK